ncbi:NAD(P)H-dependent flavin oxidoreductase [Leifsonia sp. AG29]|uniref:NAD(P)H-dependent flavin oxidoreductase n=1 Tax=Leifsonia sp. AG29 TaxID=2598860 RepID=UPI00131C3A23|nr:DUF561 domain-containing protein [Leifsonia sp. AG29]
MTSRALTDLLGIEHPLLLGPFGGLSSVPLTARVSELGGLGAFGLYGYDAARIRETVAALRASTSKPFSLNLWVPTGDEVTPQEVDLTRARAAVQPLFDELGLPVPAVPASFLPSFDEQVAAVLEARPAAMSFVFGVPPAAVVEAAHSAGIVVMAAATTVAEAVALERGGVDVVVASGFEGAGHRPSFLRPAQESLVGGIALVPQVVDAVSVPVVAAGGIADRRGVAAAFALGASGVQVGTAFLATDLSVATPGHREVARTAAADDTVLTRVMSGRFARGIPNPAMRTIEAAGEGAIAPFPAQNWLTGAFRAEAARQDRPDLVSLWAGQGASLSPGSDAQEVFAELLRGVPGE